MGNEYLIDTANHIYVSDLLKSHTQNFNSNGNRLIDYLLYDTKRYKCQRYCHRLDYIIATVTGNGYRDFNFKILEFFKVNRKKIYPIDLSLYMHKREQKLWQ